VDRACYDDEVAFLRRHVEVIELGCTPGGARVAVVPRWQGRVATSSAGGPDDQSYGWLNHELIAAGEIRPHMNAYGGEDRFWMGPEGGQFAIFFAPGDPFDLEHWQTPAAIDTEPYAVVLRGERHVEFQHETTLTNWSGARFDVRIDRRIDLIGVHVPDAVRAVAFESVNTITNVGLEPWTHEGGLLSIWTVGMFEPTPATTVVIPYVRGPVEELGPVVNDAYFGKVPAERLVAGGCALFFRADGLRRGKIGLTPRRARPVLGSYDASRSLLTIVRYDLPSDAREYVNSMWELQEQPFSGDAINSYNDGPPGPGAKPLGPFYELETSSPAAALVPGGSLTHRHRTVHHQGPPDLLAPIARAELGVSIEEISLAFARPRGGASRR